MDGRLILIGTGASLAAGLATGIGALPVLFMRRLSGQVQDALLGFAAGVMLAASFLSLILPGIEAVRAETGSGTAGAAIVGAALLIGAAALRAANRLVPHEHFVFGLAGRRSPVLRRIWLFVAAITLHNFPEGLAVGIGFGGGDLANGTTLAIGLQNMPEGLAVAAALVSLGYARHAALRVALATGLVEPLGGLLGAATVAVSQPLLPWGMGFAAGAMLFVISNEIIPETHRKGHEDAATVGLMVGLVVMTMLDTAFT
ncbi:MAG: ZIP family metal transporter [Acetobacteraceae bacterium]|nr:ZIP family metal transporter [Acetobacteraceae bacterium]